jgi:hypothetical protein
MAAMSISKGFANEEVAMIAASLGRRKRGWKRRVSRRDDASAIGDEDPNSALQAEEQPLKLKLDANDLAFTCWVIFEELLDCPGPQSAVHSFILRRVPWRMAMVLMTHAASFETAFELCPKLPRATVIDRFRCLRACLLPRTLSTTPSTAGFSR